MRGSCGVVLNLQHVQIKFPPLVLFIHKVHLLPHDVFFHLASPLSSSVGSNLAPFMTELHREELAGHEVNSTLFGPVPQNYPLG